MNSPDNCDLLKLSRVRLCWSNSRDVSWFIFSLNVGGCSNFSVITILMILNFHENDWWVDDYLTTSSYNFKSFVSLKHEICGIINEKDESVF